MLAQWLKRLLSRPTSKKERILTLAKELAEFDDDPNRLPKNVEHMLDAHEFGLAVWTIHSAIDEIESVPSDLEQRIAALYADYAEVIRFLLEPE